MNRKTNENHDNIQSRELGTDTVKCASVNGKLDAEIISMCIVAVWVGHKSTTKMVMTYAMLDNCTQGSFIKERSLKGLLNGLRYPKHMKFPTCRNRRNCYTKED